MFQDNHKLELILREQSAQFARVINYTPGSDKLLHLDLSENNEELKAVDFFDTEKFAGFISEEINSAGARFAYGGYNELRPVYERSAVFSGGFRDEEPRRLHLGIDIWATAGTPVHAPLGGMVHSYAFNDQFGDYGATIILQHQLDTVNFYSLYGHLSLRDITGLREGQYFSRGQAFAHLGVAAENGHWPPHLHFQLINQMGHKKGDYPGVCKYSEREIYLRNCPDPNLILGFGND